jgi:chromosome segregation ATPase
VKKIVRVRRTPQPSVKTSSSATASPKNEKMVVFTPGPVGLQLEPVNENPCYGCRIVRFVDGGPHNPGQARKSNKIKPGDLVLKVEAEGTRIAATTYEEMIKLLKHTHVRRILTVKSVWDDEQLLGNDTSRMQATMTSSTGPPSKTSAMTFIPTRKASASSKIHSSRSRFTSVRPTVPVVPEEEQVIISSPKSTSSPINNELIKSPSDMVLLSHSLEDLSHISTTSSKKSMTDGPIIVPLNEPLQEIDEKANEIEYEDSNEKFENDSDGEDSITRSRSPSSNSLQTTKSSNKSASTTNVDMAPQSLADQFLFIDGYTGALAPESPYASYSQSMDSGESETGNAALEDDEEPRTPVQELTYSSDNETESSPDSVKSHLQRQQDLLDQSLLRADFEQKLQTARMEYSKAERELKDLYVQTCDRNEQKIRELQGKNSTLNKSVKSLTAANTNLKEESASRSMELEMCQTMVKELEARVIAVEAEKNQVVIELHKAAVMIEELEVSQQEKDQEIASKDSQLGLARNTTSRLETLLCSEREAGAAMKGKIETLEEHLQTARHQAVGMERTLVERQTRMDEFEAENRNLSQRVESLEQYKRETEALTEKLSKSMQQKQKALSDGQSIVSRLEEENETLAQQVNNINRDVEHLLREKLEMETKLADTWKDYQQAKKDASMIHETIMEKLEHGEFFTAADFEEKQQHIEALQKQLKCVQQESFAAGLQKVMKAVHLHVRLHYNERTLGVVKAQRDEVWAERDSLRDSLDSIKGYAAEAHRLIDFARKDFDLERTANAQLQQQVQQLFEENQSSRNRYATEVDALQMEINRTKSELSALASAKDKIEQQHKSRQYQLQQEVKAVQRDLVSAESEMKQAKEECNAINSEKEKLCLKLQEATTAKDAIERELQLKIEALAASEDKVIAAERALSIFAQCLSESKAEMNEISQKFEVIVEEKLSIESDSRLKIETMQAELDVLREEVDRCGMDVESVTQEKDVVLAGLNCDIEELTKEVQAKEEKIASVLLLVKEMERGKGVLEHEKAQLQSQIHLLNETIKQHNNSHEEQITALEEIIRAKEEGLQSAKSKFEQLQEELSSMKSDFERKALELRCSNEEGRLKNQKYAEDLRSKFDSKVLEFEEKQIAFNAQQRHLTVEKDALVTENDRLVKLHQQDVDDLLQQLASSQEGVEYLKAKLREIEESGAGIEAVKEYQKQLQTLTTEAEEVATTYWEDVEKLTTELQLKEELLICAETRMSHLEEEIRILQCKMTDLEATVVHDQTKAVKLQTEIDSKAKLLEVANSQRSKFEETISELREKSVDLEYHLSESTAEALFLQENLSLLEAEKDDMQEKLKRSLEQNQQFEQELEKNLAAHQDKEKLLLELLEKTEQLESQNIVTASLHNEMSSLVSVINHLQEEVEELQGALTTEKNCKEHALSDASDAKMEINILTSKLTSQIVAKEEALCKSENVRSKLARNLLQANAVVASLKVQLKEASNLQTTEQLVETLETVSFLQATLREKDIESLLQSRKMQDLTNQLSSLQAENSKLREFVVEAEQLHWDLETKANQISELEATLRRAEFFAESACTSLEAAQQSEEDLRDTFAMWRRNLKNEIKTLRRSHSTPKKSSQDSSMVDSPGSTVSYGEEGSSLEYELSSISNEMESLSALVERRSNEIDDLHQSVSDLAAKLIAKEDATSALVHEKEDLKTSILRHEARLQASKADDRQHIHDLEKLVLATRASCVAIQVRKRNLQKMVAVEKSDLLKNIEDLSARLLSMEDLDKKQNVKHTEQVFALQKAVLKLRAEYIVKSLQTKLLECDIQYSEKELVSVNTLLSALGKESEIARIEIAKFVEGGKCIGDFLAALMRDMEQSTACLKHVKQEKQKLLETNQHNLSMIIRTQKALQQKDSHVNVLKERLDELSAQLTETSTHCSTLNQEHTRLQNANTTLQHSVEATQSLLLEARNSSSYLQERVAVLEEALETVLMEKKGLSHDYHDASEATDVLSWSIEQNMARSETVEIEKHMIAREHEILQNEHAKLREAMSSLESDCDAQKARLETITLACNDKTTELTSLQGALEEREAQNASLRSLIEERNQSIGDLRSSMRSMEEEQRSAIIALSTLSRALDKERSKATALTSIQNDLEVKLDDKVGEIRTLQESFLRKQEEIDSLHDDNVRIEEEQRACVQALEHEVKNLQDQLKLCKVEAQHKLEECVRIERQNKSMAKELQELKKKIETYESDRKTSSASEDEIHRVNIQATQQERKIVELKDTIAICKEESAEKEALIMEKEAKIIELNQTFAEKSQCITRLEEQTLTLASTIEILTQQLEQVGTNQHHGMTDEMAKHVSAVKEAFRVQANVLEDAKLSENVLTNFMDEVMRLAGKAEKEALEMISTLTSVEDLLIRPSSCLASLDLAGIGAANEYVEEVRTRLEDMAALAYNTNVELKVRQSEFNQWKASRQAPPAVPVTPPTKPLKRVLFDCGPISDRLDMQRKLTGARLLNCVIEQHSKKQLASAFRKWSCNSGAISASAGHRETAIALAQQLEQTREKLLVLKSHLKGKQQKPRLRRILERLDSNSNHGQDDAAEMHDNNQSFGI